MAPDLPDFQLELERIADEISKNFKDGVLTIDFEDCTKIPRTNYEEFFMNRKLSDILLIVGEYEIPCHKIVLAAHSKAFFNLFCNIVPDSSPIVIKDVGYSGFNIFLEYIYKHDTSITEEAMFDVLKLAARYEMDQLETKAITFICENINMENAFSFLGECLKLEHTLMIEILFRFIGRNIETVIEKKYYLSASYDALLAFIGQSIAKCPEKNLAEMCVQWAMHKCREAATPEILRQTLGEILDNIRFPLMGRNDFEKFIDAYQLLNETEITNYRNYFQGLPNNLRHQQTQNRTIDFVNLSGPFERVSFTRKHASSNVAYPNHFKRSVKVMEETFVCGIGIRMKKSVELAEGAYLVINNKQIDFGENFKRCHRQQFFNDEDLIVVKFPQVYVMEAEEYQDFCFYNPNGFGIGCNEIIYAVGTDCKEFWHSRPYAPEKHNNALICLYTRYLQNDKYVFETKLFTDFIC